MAATHFVLFLFLATTKSVAEISTTTRPTTHTTLTQPENSAHKPGVSQGHLVEQTTESFLSKNVKAMFAPIRDKNKIHSLAAKTIDIPETMAKFLSKHVASGLGGVSPSQQHMMNIQGLDQALDRMLAGQPPDSRIMKIFNEAIDRSGVDINFKDMLEGSGEMENKSSTDKNNASQDDSSVEDLIRFLCSVFDGSTYITDVIEKIKGILDRTAFVFDVDCSPVVKAARCLLDILLCIFAGNADSALEQLKPFMTKHYTILFRAVTQFFNIPEKIANVFMESVKKSTRQIMTFISENPNFVDMVISFIRPVDAQGVDQNLIKGSDNFEQSERKHIKVCYQVDIPSPHSEKTSDIDTTNQEDTSIFSILNGSADTVGRIKKVIELVQALLRGKRSLTETVSLGQQALEAVSPLLRWNVEYDHFHKLVLFLDRVMCVMRDTPDSDVKDGLTEVGNESTQFLVAAKEFLRSGGAKASATSLIEQLRAFLERLLSTVNTWDNQKSSDYMH
ncbi:hypothetical protein BgiBS90_022366 [Biomphalaria glabrata]|nr:hypothetical protein BgiBS90_022366 [Biomphalaria glabrata]